MNAHQPSKFYELSKDIALSSSPDLLLAKKYLEKASSEGDHRATYALSTWYIYGNDVVEINIKNAVYLLKSIKECNIAEAMFDLAYCYDTGNGISKNEKSALKYYMKAALLGDPESCLQVSQFYAEGRVIPYDKFLSQIWKERSAYTAEEISPAYRIKI